MFGVGRPECLLWTVLCDCGMNECVQLITHTKFGVPQNSWSLPPPHAHVRARSFRTSHTRRSRSSRSKLHATNIHSSTMLLQLDYISQVQFTLESKVLNTIISTVCIVEFQRVTSVGKLVMSPARRRRTSTTHGSADTQTQLCKLRRSRDSHT